jgi:hypothetical protein
MPSRISKAVGQMLSKSGFFLEVSSRENGACSGRSLTELHCIPVRFAIDDKSFDRFSPEFETLIKKLPDYTGG